MPHIDAGVLQAWLDAETSEADNRAVDEHLEQCERCRASLDEAVRIGAQADEIVAELAPIVMPEWSELLARAASEGSQEQVAVDSRSGPRLVPVLAWAATVALAFALGWYGRWPAGDLPTPERQIAALEESVPDRQVPAAVPAPAPQSFLSSEQLGEEKATVDEALRVASARSVARVRSPNSIDLDALGPDTLVLGEAELVTATLVAVPAALAGTMDAVVLQLVFNDPFTGAVVTLLQPPIGRTQGLASGAAKAGLPSARLAPVPQDNVAFELESPPLAATLLVLPDGTKALQWTSRGRVIVLTGDVDESVLRQLRLRVR